MHKSPPSYKIFSKDGEREVVGQAHQAAPAEEQAREGLQESLMCRCHKGGEGVEQGVQPKAQEAAGEHLAGLRGAHEQSHAHQLPRLVHYLAPDHL